MRKIEQLEQAQVFNFIFNFHNSLFIYLFIVHYRHKQFQYFSNLYLYIQIKFYFRLSIREYLDSYYIELPLMHSAQLEYRIILSLSVVIIITGARGEYQGGCGLQEVRIRAQECERRNYDVSLLLTGNTFHYFFPLFIKGIMHHSSFF